MQAPLCLIMAGGRGSRLGGVVKPLLECRGARLVEHVLGEAVRACRFTLLVLSPRTTSSLKRYCGHPLVSCIEGSGVGLVEDLSTALRATRPRPVLVAAADLLFTRRGCLEEFLEAALGVEASVVTGVSSSGEPVGLSLFHRDSGDWVDITLDCVVDVDTPRELEEYCRRGENEERVDTSGCSG